MEFVLTALTEFEICFYFCQNMKKKTRIPCQKTEVDFHHVCVTPVSFKYYLQTKILYVGLCKKLILIN
jgi:hypothetical protein